MSICVIMACYNRLEHTILCLESLFEAAATARVRITVVLFDDGSTDGTARAVTQRFPMVKIIEGSGDYYWARSMAAAEQLVIADPSSEYSHLVWLNDDVQLDVDALARAKRELAKHPNSILAGAVRDPMTNVVTYAGFRRRGMHPLSFEMVQPTKDFRPIETFNGNFILVPWTIAKSLGGIDGKFSHALADIEYGIRAYKHDVRALLMPGTYGTCSRNPSPEYAGLLVAWKAFLGPKGGGNYSSLMHYYAVTKQKLPLLYVLISYLKWWMSAIFNRKNIGCQLKKYRVPRILER